MIVDMRNSLAAMTAAALCLVPVSATSQEASCTVSSSAMNFGVVGLLDSHADSTSEVAINCPVGSAFSVGLDGGQANAGPAGRQLSSGSATISYGLYRDPARTQLWGQDGDAAGAVSGTGSGSDRIFTVYGRIPRQFGPIPGAYTDAITVVVTY